MTYFGLVWWPIGKLLQAFFLFYFLGQHFKFWLRGKISKWKRKGLTLRS